MLVLPEELSACNIALLSYAWRVCGLCVCGCVCVCVHVWLIYSYRSNMPPNEWEEAGKWLISMVPGSSTDQELISAGSSHYLALACVTLCMRYCLSPLTRAYQTCCNEPFYHFFHPLHWYMCGATGAVRCGWSCCWTAVAFEPEGSGNVALWKHFQQLSG